MEQYILSDEWLFLTLLTLGDAVNLTVVNTGEAGVNTTGPPQETVINGLFTWISVIGPKMACRNVRWLILSACSAVKSASTETKTDQVATKAGTDLCNFLKNIYIFLPKFFHMPYISWIWYVIGRFSECAVCNNSYREERKKIPGQVIVMSEGFVLFLEPDSL